MLNYPQWRNNWDRDNLCGALDTFVLLRIIIGLLAMILIKPRKDDTGCILYQLLNPAKDIAVHSISLICELA